MTGRDADDREAGIADKHCWRSRTDAPRSDVTRATRAGRFGLYAIIMKHVNFFEVLGANEQMPRLMVSDHRYLWTPALQVHCRLFKKDCALSLKV